MNERLEYVAKPCGYQGRAGRPDSVDWICRPPWTLSNFMIEGGGVKEYTKAKALFYSDPGFLHG